MSEPKIYRGKPRFSFVEAFQWQGERLPGLRKWVDEDTKEVRFELHGGLICKGDWLSREYPRPEKKYGSPITDEDWGKEWRVAHFFKLDEVDEVKDHLETVEPGELKELQSLGLQLKEFVKRLAGIEK